MQEIPIVDLFAGPGGLGEGFSAFSPEGSEAARVFRIAVSAEMDPTAHATLRLRAFFRQFENPEDVPQKYYDYIAGRVSKEEFEADPALSEYWRKADEEALCLTLGEADDNEQLDQRLRVVLKDKKHWVLIGGPPCQAYSLVGRARNQGNADYRAEDDHRHFLYKEYLRIIRDYQPSIFVMENVKGILSSKVNGEVVFHKILDDLMGPFERRREGKRVLPLVIGFFLSGRARGWIETVLMTRLIRAILLFDRKNTASRNAGTAYLFSESAKTSMCSRRLCWKNSMARCPPCRT